MSENTQDQVGIVTQVQRVKEFVDNSAKWYRETSITVTVSEVLHQVSGLMDVLLTGGDLEKFLDGTGLYSPSVRYQVEDVSEGVSEDVSEGEGDMDASIED